MSTCKEFLKAYRKTVNAKKDEKIDKRYKPYLAPNNKYYDSHCGYCAEVAYLETIYAKGGIECDCADPDCDVKIDVKKPDSRISAGVKAEITVLSNEKVIATIHLNGSNVKKLIDQLQKTIK